LLLWGVLISCAAPIAPTTTTVPSCADARFESGIAAPSLLGMRRVPAGRFVMGQPSSRRTDEVPAHLVCLPAFDLDETLVTVAAFAKFVDDTGYQTTAELMGHGMVAYEGMDDWQWHRVAGAWWRQPFGATPPDDFVLRDDHPVTSVSFADALAYCRHRQQRLPTEAEWEYAMRAGATTRYPWGNSPVRPDGRYGLNHWQGADHHRDDTKDGHIYLSPVRAYPPNAWGFYDPVGNVWQLTQDRYSTTTYADRANPGGVWSPTGPDDGSMVVSRGGSWWCSKGTCEGYGLSYRGKARPEAAFNNVGFRCAADVLAALPQRR
jgi:formylglycine-generating enzyme